MRTSPDKKPLRARRLSSLFGKGMPERIRNFGFAFLGLTAAAGLAVVAIFAQMSFPLLSPAPLPNAPSDPGSVSKAVALGENSATVGLAQSRSAAAAPNPAGGQGDSKAAPGREGGSGVDRSADPVSGSVSGNGSRSTDPSQPAGSPAAAPSPAPAPTPTTIEPTPAPVETPVSSPGTGSKPDRSPPVTSDPDKPKAQPAAAGKPPRREPKPVKPAKSPKGTPAKPAKPVEPEPKPAKTATTPVPEPAPVPAPEGKDKLQESGETAKKGK